MYNAGKGTVTLDKTSVKKESQMIHLNCMLKFTVGWHWKWGGGAFLLGRILKRVG